MEKFLIGDGGFWSIVLSALVYGIALLVLLLILSKRARILTFFRDVKAELAKCTWPVDPEQTGLRRYKVLIDSTVVVCVCTVLLAGYITGFDFCINKFIGLLVNF